MDLNKTLSSPTGILSIGEGKKLIAFTLAEVLITLGIIGVVAAMTIPTLMTKVHRQKVETKLRKFHSTVNQAMRMSIADNGDLEFMDTSDVTDNGNSDRILTWYNENLVKYMSGASSKRLDTQYVKVTLKDGSGFTSYMSYDNNNGSTALYIFYCLDASDKSCVGNSYNGQNTFLFNYSGKHKMIIPNCAEESFERCKQRCYVESKAYRHCCAELIKKNGWKIPDDYPWIK